MKFYRLLFLFLCFFLSFNTQAKTSTLAARDTISIVYANDTPPYSFYNYDSEQGLLIEIWRNWSVKSGVAIEFIGVPQENTLALLNKGQADIHIGLITTDINTHSLSLSDPLLSVNHHIFYRNNLPAIKNIEQLMPYRVAVLAGEAQAQLTDKLPQSSAVVFDDLPSLYHAVTNGEISAFISPIASWEYYLKKHKIENKFIYSSLVIFKEDYRAAITVGSSIDIEEINSGLQNISDLEKSQLQMQWLIDKKKNEKKTYRIAADSDYAPLSMLNTQGKAAGLLIDIWKAWAVAENVNVEFMFDDWKESLELVKQGKADFHSGATVNSDWQMGSNSFYQLDALFYFPENRPIKDIDDISGSTIGVISPYYGDLLEKRIPGIKIKIASNYIELLQWISENKIQLFFDDEFAVEDMLTRQGRLGDFSKFSKYHVLSSIQAIVKKGNDQLLARMGI